MVREKMPFAYRRVPQRAARLTKPVYLLQQMRRQTRVHMPSRAGGGEIFDSGLVVLKFPFIDHKYYEPSSSTRARIAMVL